MSRFGGGWLPSVWGSVWAAVPWVGIHSPCCFMCGGPTCGVGDYNVCGVLPIRWQWALRGGERVVAPCVRETGTGECPLR